MSHKETDIDCTSFDSCLIVGRSNDDASKSNGVGKSTIFWGIAFALFDEVPTKKVNGIIRDGKTVCKVIFEFESEGRYWQITRVRSKTTQVELKEKINGEWVCLDQRTLSQTNEVILDIIKINYKSFCNSVLFSQGAFSELAEATDGDRRKLLKEPLSLAIYSKYEKEAKNNLSDFDTKYNKIKTIINTIGDPKSDIKDLKVEIKNIDNQILTINNDREKLGIEISKIEEQASNIERMLSSDSAKLTEKLVDIDKNKSSYTIDINRYESKIRDYKSAILKLESQKNDIQSKIEPLQIKLAELSNKKLRTDEEIKEAINKIQKTENDGNKYISSLKYEFEKFSKELPNGSQCESCFNELTDEYREKISKDNLLKANSILEKIIESESKMKILSVRKNDCNKERSELIDHVRLLNETESSIILIKSKLESLQVSLKDNEEMLSKTLSILDELKSKLSKEQELELVIKEQIKEFNINDLNEKILLYKSNIRDLKSKDNDFVKTLSSVSSNKGSVSERLKKRIEDLEQLNKLSIDVVEIESKMKLWRKVVKAFSSTGIPTLIIHTILDDLQSEANSILQDLRPDISLQFYIESDDKDTLDIIYKINGQSRDYLQLSGGQKTFISFALKLGLSLVIQKRLGVNLKMLQLDEVDQPLDRSGQDAFVNVVKKYQNRFKIFVVTHNDRLKDKFSHAIMVESSSDGSVGKLVTEW